MTLPDPVQQFLEQDDATQAEIQEWIREAAERLKVLERSTRKMELDFTTILETANLINSKVVDDRNLDSYLTHMMNYLVSTGRGQFGVSKVLFFQMDDEDVLVPIETGPTGGDIAPIPAAEFSAQVIRRGGPVRLEEHGFEDVEDAISALQELGVSVVVPLMVSEAGEDSQLKGLLCYGPKILRQPFSDSEIRFMGLLGNMIGIAMHNAELHRKSIVDSLTQLFSRGHFDAHLSREISRAHRKSDAEEGGEPGKVTLILLDVDHFKSFNDTYGHQVGDEVLRTMGRILRENIRKSDVVARYGGEEFALIASETGVEMGAQLAERLRSSVESTPIDVDGKPVGITASFGVAEFPGDADGFQDLVAKADLALYSAKESGRNKVVAFRNTEIAAETDSGS